jgi:hypothetical protein
VVICLSGQMIVIDEIDTDDFRVELAPALR